MTAVSNPEGVPKAVYTNDFKEEAVRLVTEAGLSIPEVSHRLSVNKSTIEHWVKQTRKIFVSGNPGKRAVTAEDIELALLRKENAELKMKGEILKNRVPSGFRRCAQDRRRRG